MSMTRDDTVDRTMLAEINRLRTMSVAELQARWLEVFREPTRSRNHRFLWRRLAWELQARAHGGLSAAALERLRDLAPDHFPRAVVPRGAFQELVGNRDPALGNAPQTIRDHRLPPAGSVIVKLYRGRQLRLTVHEDHFELDGHSFASLSQAARHASGARWDGFLFWNLKQRKRRS